MASVLKVLDRWSAVRCVRGQFRATTSNFGRFWRALFLKMRCRTSIIDVLRGSQFSTAAGGLVRILHKSGCVSMVILFRNSRFGRASRFRWYNPATARPQWLEMARHSTADWTIPQPFTDTSSVKALE